MACTSFCVCMYLHTLCHCQLVVTHVTTVSFPCVPLLCCMHLVLLTCSLLSSPLPSCLSPSLLTLLPPSSSLPSTCYAIYILPFPLLTIPVDPCIGCQFHLHHCAHGGHCALHLPDGSDDKTREASSLCGAHRDRQVRLHPGELWLCVKTQV